MTLFYQLIFCRQLTKLKLIILKLYFLLPQKNLFIKKLAIFTGKHLCWSLFLIKLLQRILQNVSEHLFWQTSANDCFCFSYEQCFRDKIVKLLYLKVFAFSLLHFAYRLKRLLITVELFQTQMKISVVL